MYYNKTQQSKHTFLNHALLSDLLKNRAYKLKKKFYVLVALHLRKQGTNWALKVHLR